MSGCGVRTTSLKPRPEQKFCLEEQTCERRAPVRHVLFFPRVLKESKLPASRPSLSSGRVQNSPCPLPPEVRWLPRGWGFLQTCKTHQMQPLLDSFSSSSHRPVSASPATAVAGSSIPRSVSPAEVVSVGRSCIHCPQSVACFMTKAPGAWLGNSPIQTFAAEALAGWSRARVLESAKAWLNSMAISRTSRSPALLLIREVLNSRLACS